MKRRRIVTKTGTKWQSFFAITLLRSKNMSGRQSAACGICRVLPLVAQFGLS
jgi:hypothetical protein